MSTLLQICFVIVTIAVAAIAISVINAVKHFKKTSEEVNKLALETRQWIQQLQGVTQTADEVVSAFRDVAPRVRGVIERFEAIGERTLGISDAVLHEVELPVRQAVAMARGVRYGAQRFVELLSRRFSGRVTTNGGRNYE